MVALKQEIEEATTAQEDNDYAIAYLFNELSIVFDDLLSVGVKKENIVQRAIKLIIEKSDS